MRNKIDEIVNNVKKKIVHWQHTRLFNCYAALNEVIQVDTAFLRAKNSHQVSNHLSDVFEDSFLNSQKEKKVLTI